MFTLNPTGSSGFAKTLDPRLLGNHPSTLVAWLLSASGAERHAA